MKEIQKEIKVTRYVAFDGTEFENDYECRNYENSQFGSLLKQIENEILFANNDGYYCDPDGNTFNRYYGVVQKNRTDVRVLNNILEMAGEEPTANGGSEGKLLLLCVNLCCNDVCSAKLYNVDDFVRRISGGKFGAVSLIKEK
ncbi:MAG: hypothetical protein J6X18_12585 [Bacteroidales bacterium]|nr:hypothetical protein [Bacteroidales bacterium]